MTIAQIIARIRKVPVPYSTVAAASGVSVDLIKKIMAGRHSNITLGTAAKLNKGLSQIERTARRPRKPRPMVQPKIAE